MASKNTIIEKNVVTSRRFFYRKRGVTLDFNLVVDTDKDLKDYRELLQKGIEDIDITLKDFEN